jgi:hypothetical protein
MYVYIYIVRLIQLSEQTTLPISQKRCSVQQDNSGLLRTLENTNLPQKHVKQAYNLIVKLRWHITHYV